jgi:hypothetical protein
MKHPRLLPLSRISGPAVEQLPGTDVRLHRLAINVDPITGADEDGIIEIHIYMLPTYDGWSQATDMVAWIVQEVDRGADPREIYEALIGSDWSVGYDAVVPVLWDGDGSDEQGVMMPRLLDPTMKWAAGVAGEGRS